MKNNLLLYHKKIAGLGLIVVLWWGFMVTSCYAQPSESYSQNALAEKVYLQLDGNVYTNDKTIWFKAIVTRAADHLPTELSRVLHVELIGPNEQILEKKLIKLNHGIGCGSFELSSEVAEGVYQLRAYTEWNYNFDPEFIFTTYIRVFSLYGNTKADPIGKITLLQEPNKDRRLKASMDPLLIDSLHKKEMILVLSFDEKSDTLWIRKGNDDKYHLDVAIPERIKLATLHMITKNHLSYIRTIALEDQFDLQFFPEGGELVHGLRSKVAFKLLDVNGKGFPASGEILDSSGNIITLFKSNRLGMGAFLMTEVDSSKRYFARLTAPTTDQPSRLYPLPSIARQGNVLGVYKAEDEIRIKISSTYLKNDSIRLKIACRGVTYFDVTSWLKEGSLIFAVKDHTLPEGVLAITFTDRFSNPLAERLFFNERKQSRLQIQLQSDKSAYIPREETILNMVVKNAQGEPVASNLSLLVINRKQLGLLQQNRQNILSNLLLSSDLKGEIEDPGSYFTDSIRGFYNLDALMLTQGWRRYRYTQPAEKITWQPQYTLTLSGSVSGILSRKNRKISDLTLLTFGKKKSVQAQMTDSTGRFKFYLEDEFGQNMNILLQSGNGKGENKNYHITLDTRQSPPIRFDPGKTIEKVDSIVKQLVEKNKERKKVDEAYKLSAGEIMLGEIVVEAYKMTPERQKVMEEYGKPKDVIEGQAIVDKEQKWSYGLYSILMNSFPGKVIIRRARDGNLYARVRQSEMTLVVIDGMAVKYWDYPFIPNIPPGEVKSFEIIENAKNFSSLYLETYPQANPQCIPAWGDVIAIYTHAAKGIYGTRPPVGIMKATVPIFSVAKEFYQPKYKNLQPEDWYKPDLRALVHWEPEIVTGSDGKASASFYNADLPGEMMVVVEAISAQGALGYCEMNYQISKK